MSCRRGDLSEPLVLDYDFVPETTHLPQLEASGVCVHFMLELPAQTLPGWASTVKRRQ